MTIYPTIQLGSESHLAQRICTPTGPKLATQLNTSDKVIDPQGQICDIAEIQNHNQVEMFEITFSDNRTLTCPYFQLWELYLYGWGSNKLRTMQTDTIMPFRHGRKLRNFKLNHPVCVNFDNQSLLPLCPYVLGLLLGDGSFRNGIAFTSKDQFLVDTLTERLAVHNCTIKHKNRYDYSVITKDPSIAQQYIHKQHKNEVKEIIKQLGLYGHLSADKFIPAPYIYSAQSQRLQLIQGLVDTDGTIDRTVCYGTSSRQLADDFKFMIWSLGGLVTEKAFMAKYKTAQGNFKTTQMHYHLRTRYPNPTDLTSLPRKKELITPNYQYKDALRPEIIKLEPCGKSDWVTIITNGYKQGYLSHHYIPFINS